MSRSIYDLSAWKGRPSKLAILVPCREQVYATFSSSLVELVKTTTLVGHDVHVLYDMSTILLNQRENLAKRALEINAEWILWLDSDMIFPSTTAIRLMAHNESIVAANYMKRAAPLTTVAYEKLGDWDSWLPLESQEELEEVEGIGMGCVLMDTKLLGDIVQPWFAFTWQEEQKDWMGEDFYFQQKLREAGHKIMVDMNLSRQIRHVGHWAYGPSIGTNEDQIVKRKLVKQHAER
jgi:hypothetical protein